MCRTIGDRPVTLTTTVQILMSVCSGSSLLHLPRSSLKDPIYTYLPRVFIFFPFESIKSLFSGRMSTFCILGVEGRPVGDRMGSVFGQQSVTKQRLSQTALETQTKTHDHCFPVRAFKAPWGRQPAWGPKFPCRTNCQELCIALTSPNPM